MKKFMGMIIFMLLTVTMSYGQLFINEIDYDQPGDDAGEFVEIAGLAGNYTSVILEPVNGNGNTVYDAVDLGNITITDSGNGYGFYKIDTPGIQNGAPDGVQLKVNGSIVDAVSYEGSMNDTEGNFMESIDNSGSDMWEGGADSSVSRIGVDGSPWIVTTATPGAINTGQTLDANANYAPIANAGSDQTVDVAEVVTLDGSSSTDPENGTLTYAWEIVSGTGITLSAIDAAVVTFTVPTVTENTTWTFGLTVTDDEGQSDSDTLSVSVIVSAMTIAEARALGEGTLVTVKGLITTENMSTSKTEYPFQDATAGLILKYLDEKINDYHIGDEIEVTGSLVLYYGILEIQPVSKSDIVVISSGNIIPTPQVITVAQFNANPEGYVSELIQVLGVSIQSGAWVDGDFEVTDNGGSDKCAIYIDTATDIAGNTEPSWPVDVIGYVSSYDGVWQIVPRMYSDLSGNEDAPTFGEPILTMGLDGPTFLTSSGPISASVIITPAENSTIISVSLKYGADGVFPDTYNVNMVFVAGTYYCEIPVQTGNTILDYKIVANGFESKVYSSMIASSTPTDIAFIHEKKDSLDGMIATIQGIVTIGSGLLQTDMTKAYIQDASGRGLNLFDYEEFTDIERGAELIVIGEIDLYYTTLEIKDFSYKILNIGQTLPEANEVSIDSANSLAWEGTYIKIHGLVTAVNDYGSNTVYTVADTVNNAKTVEINNWHTTGLVLDDIVVDTRNSFKGVGSAFNNEFQLLIAYVEDLDLLTAIDDNSSIPSEFKLHSAYPNPFNPMTTLALDISQAGDISVNIYDINGRLVSTITRENVQAGHHKIKWNASKYSSGIYVMKVQLGDAFAFQKVTLIK